MEVVDDTPPPQDTSDFNPFSVLPQDEGTTNLAPSSSPPPVPDPISQVTASAASPPSPPTEILPSTDVDAILSDLYDEGASTETRIDPTLEGKNPSGKQKPKTPPESKKTPTATETETQTSDPPMEITQQLFNDTPEDNGNTSDMELDLNLKRKITLLPRDCIS